jgi:hypothetical protein
MNSSPSTTPPGKMVAWKHGPFDRFMGYIKQAHRLFHLTIHGIQILTTQDKLVEALVNYDNVVSGQSPTETPSEAGEASPDARIEAAREEAAFARKEAESDFYRLRAHTLLDMWGALEVLVEDIIVAWLRNVPELLESDEVARVRVPLGEFQKLDEEERFQYLAQELTRDKKAGLKAGATRFEMMLAVVGLDGQVEELLRRDLFEANRVRNVIAHRGGIADRQLLKTCPWLSLRAGEPVPLGAAESNRYEMAVINYAMTVFNRIRAADNLPPI